MSIKDYFEAVREDEAAAKRAKMKRIMHKKIVQSKKIQKPGRLKHLNKQIKRLEEYLEKKAA